jgi:uncharacterized protein YndB with AHSA1/START domain
MGRIIPIYGRYTAVQPVGHLAFTHQWEKPPVPVNPAHHHTLVTVDLHEEGPRKRGWSSGRPVSPAKRIAR